MARARNIKPAFFQNDKLGELDPLARLAFIGMWTIADFKGCIEYRPKMLKVQILPYDDCDIEEIVINLEQARFIRFYAEQGNRYIKIINFEKHQNPHKNEKEAGSHIPDITEINSINNMLTQDGTKPDLIGSNTEQLALIPDSLVLIPSTPIPDSLNHAHPSDALSPKPPKRDHIPYQKIVDLYHETLPTLPRIDLLTATRKGQIAARWKNGLPDLSTWKEYFEHVGESKFLMGKSDPSNGHKRFVADLEWITKESNFAKIVEGKYHGV